MKKEDEPIVGKILGVVAVAVFIGYTAFFFNVFQQEGAGPIGALILGALSAAIATFFTAIAIAAAWESGLILVALILGFFALIIMGASSLINSGI